MTHVFVVPDMEATISGGNLYNLALISALRDAGTDLRVVDLDGGEAVLRQGTPGVYIVDSLYLDALPRLRQLLPAGSSLHLLAHYLPSLVAHGRVPHASLLSASERAALSAADGFFAPSDYLARALATLGVARARVRVIPPGSPLLVAGTVRSDAHDPAPAPLCGILIANLVPGKGVLPFLEALSAHAQDAPLQLTIVGSLTVDPHYAAACRAYVAGHAALSVSVRFAGPLSHHATLAELAASHLFLSPSRMESYGLALGEARALGVPILAHDGGNAAAHVDERAGGRLFTSDDALAKECSRLARDPVELSARRRAAQALRPLLRTWQDAARELLGHSAVANVRE